MDYRILGPLEVGRDDETLALPRAKQRALVLALLLQPNEPVSTDRLIEALWGDRPPPTASTALQGHVSQIRKLLPPGTLVTRAPGYELRVQAGELDVDRFRSLRSRAQAALAEGSTEEAAAALDQALALWRGAPLSELTYDAYAQNEIARLEELRAETVEERIELDLALGRHAEAVAELEPLVRAEPYRERRRAQLMLALYRSGRQAEALDVFQEGRRRLVDELGIEPGPALQELQQQILAQDPSLRAPQRRELRQAPTREARRAVTVLACGLELPSGDPEALRAASEQALDRVHEIVGRHGGVVERELPDLALATFGAGAVLEDAPHRAVRAATEIADELGARCALASGELVIGRGGAIGDAVTRAQRLQLQTAAGDVRLDPSTQQLVDVTRRLDSPLVGRAQELNVLASAFERSLAERSTQLVALVGQAGVGKSRLVGELVTRVEGRATVLRGRCLSYGDGITFWPVRELVRDADAEASEAVIAALDAEPDTDLFLAVRTLFEALGRDRPLLVVLDDLEHAEPALLDLIDFLVDWVRDVPLTLVCVGRPELLDRRPGWAGGRSGVMSVSLDALSAGECSLLLDNLLGGALDAEAAERFTAAAEGNPLFLEQLVSMLIDDGLLVKEDERWVATADLTHVPVPPSIQLLLAARLDRLTPDELTVLECASVEGTVFHREPLRADTLDLDGALRSLVAKGLIRPTTATYGDEEAYRFRHLLIRDAAYSRMPKETRGRVHARFARWIEPTEAEEVLGHHLEQAYRLLTEVGQPDPALAAAAAERLESAGRRAEARGDFASGANLLGRADELHTAAGGRNLALLPLRVSALRLSGDVRGARAAADEALEAARGDRTLEAHVLVELLSVRLMADPSVTLAEVAAGAEEARAVFDEVGDDRGRARANALLGDVSLFQCRFAEAEEAYERALEFARRAGDDQACARAHGKLAQAAFLGPRPVDRSIARCEQILEQPDADPSAKSFALAVLGVLEAMLGNVDEGRMRIVQASSLADEFGLGRALALVPGFSGCVELLAGDPGRAESELRAGYDTLTALGETAVLATTAALLAHALVAQGRVDEAAALAKENEAWVGTGDLVSRIYWAQALTRITGNERYAREATELAAETDMLAVRAAALLDLAGVLPDGEERESAVRLARELFQAKGQRAMTSM